MKTSKKSNSGRNPGSKRRSGSGRRQGRENKHSRGAAGKPLIKEESELIGLLQKVDKPFVLILDGLQDPHNLGACIRTANGAGVDAVIIPRNKSVAVTDTAARISCGGASRTPIFRVSNLARTIDALKERGLFVAGTSDHQGTQDLYEADLSGPLAMMMGSEEKGMRRLSQEKCDLLLTIPMAGHVPCLNVSVATGVCLYEAVRQRSRT